VNEKPGADGLLNFRTENDREDYSMRKHTLTRSLLAGAVLSLAASTALAGIANTKHNLGTPAGTGAVNSFSGTDEICVFCHTPHGADVSANPPLWNRVLPDPASFSTYDTLGTTTLDGEVLPVGSVSIACLSCHDGTQAMNVMINAPGSGNFNPAGFTLAGTWTGPAATATTVGSLDYGTIVNLGSDLTNDHPIGVEYAGGGCETAGPTCTPSTGGAADPDFKDIVRTAAGVDLWYVDVDTDGVREKTDMILYTRTFTGTAVPGPSVECGSCHDPHTEQGLFLRQDNAASAVCLACHDK
jgi:predicted CXXCH cytochrome family protein